jgi:fatty acid-binding protein DegV
VDSILYVAMSSKLSVSFSSATMAKEMAGNELPDVKIEVFDSMTTVGAAGKSLAQVVKTA